MHHKVKNTFDTYAAATYDKQLFLNEIIDGADAAFDLRSGIVDFGKHCWRCQVMGIQPDDTGRFRWIWSVDQTEIPDHLQKWAHSVREIGVRDSITELMEGKPSDPDVEGHFLSVMATGICQANAYFCGEYQAGTVFLLIRDAQYPVSSTPPLQRFLSALPKALQQYPVTNHRRAVTGLARFLGLNVDGDANRILIDDGDEQIITTFDDDKRLLNLSRISRHRLPT
jgi:hypothetical protein